MPKHESFQAISAKNHRPHLESSARPNHRRRRLWDDSRRRWRRSRRPVARRSNPSRQGIPRLCIVGRQARCRPTIVLALSEKRRPRPCSRDGADSEGRPGLADALVRHVVADAAQASLAEPAPAGEGAGKEQGGGGEEDEEEDEEDLVVALAGLGAAQAMEVRH